MKTYSHNYEKPSRVQSILFFALEALRSGNTFDAKKSIMEAREILDEYLAGDNMIEDNDLADGWVKHSDAIAAKKNAIDQLSDSLKKLEEADKYLSEFADAVADEELQKHDPWY